MTTAKMEDYRKTNTKEKSNRYVAKHWSIFVKASVDRVRTVGIPEGEGDVEAVVGCGEREIVQGYSRWEAASGSWCRGGHCKKNRARISTF